MRPPYPTDLSLEGARGALLLQRVLLRIRSDRISAADPHSGCRDDPCANGPVEAASAGPRRGAVEQRPRMLPCCRGQQGMAVAGAEHVSRRIRHHRPRNPRRLAKADRCRMRQPGVGSRRKANCRRMASGANNRGSNRSSRLSLARISCPICRCCQASQLPADSRRDHASIRSTGNGNTMVELRSPAISNNVAR
jgi:hypothetical protein